MFVGNKLANGDFEPQGTAFFVAIGGDGLDDHSLFLLTADHVLEAAEGNDFDGKVRLRINTEHGDFKLVATDRAESWVKHSDERVDAAAMFWRRDSVGDLAIRTFPDKTFALGDRLLARRAVVSLGDDVYFPGLFAKHHGRARNVAIVRHGKIAMLANEQELIGGVMFAHLIEARSIGGHSGSPVIVQHGPMRQLPPGTSQHTFPNDTFDVIYLLLGMVQGHFTGAMLEADSLLQDNGQESVNQGIATVVPVEKLWELLTTGGLAERAEKEKTERR